MPPLRQRRLEDRQVRNLSPHTQRAYLEHVARFARHGGRSPAALGPEEIRTYQVSWTRDLAPVRETDWGIYATRPSAGPQQVLDYVGRYMHRVAISHDRLRAIDDDHGSSPTRTTARTRPSPRRR